MSKQKNIKPKQLIEILEYAWITHQNQLAEQGKNRIEQHINYLTRIINEEPPVEIIVPPIKIGGWTATITRHWMQMRNNPPPGRDALSPGNNDTKILTAVNNRGNIVQVSTSCTVYHNAWRPDVPFQENILLGNQSQLDQLAHDTNLLLHRIEGERPAFCHY
jgi:hypothetical protein